MELLQMKIKPLYLKYLSAAFGSALIGSIYSIADMIIVGQYEGPNGTAALAIISPIWNIIFSLGILTGIGGSVLYSTVKGKAGGGEDSANELFTATFFATSILALASWLLVAAFDRELLILFGAEETLLPLALDYIKPLKAVLPVFVFSQMLAAFLRNDSNPGLATLAVISTGVINIIGDYLFVFILDMGIMGAGLATAIGTSISVLIMLTHFISKKNTLRFVKPAKTLQKFQKIFVTGSSTFIVDIAMGILTMLFNRQILRYAGTDALSVYGIIVNISTIVQCSTYSIGQATQPILSINYGAGKYARIRETLKYALWTAMLFGVIWTAVTLLFPNGIVKFFMSPTEGVLAVAPMIFRRYCLSFLLLPLNIFSTYYFQSLMKPAVALAVSMLRGFFISGILIFVLPAKLGGGAMWFTMPVTELLTAAIAITFMIYYTKNLSKSIYSKST